MYPCLVEKVSAVLPPATLERLFFVPATTVRIVTASMEWGRVSVRGREESKRGRGVGHGPLSFPAKCPTVREEDAKLEGASNTVVSTRCVERKGEGNAQLLIVSVLFG